MSTVQSQGDNGSYIFIALMNDQPVESCALIRMNYKDYDIELAKKAVAPETQGKNRLSIKANSFRQRQTFKR